MPKESELQVYTRYLYEDKDKIPQVYQERALRIRSGHLLWYDFPSKSRREIRDHLVSEFNVSTRQAYEDIILIEQLLGCIKNPEKAWVRFRVNAMLEEAYELAHKQKDPKAIAIVADKMGKYNMLDQVDQEQIPFDKIVPQPFDPTDDPSVLGLTRDPNLREKIKKMNEKYSQEIEIQDVPYTELKDDDEGED